MLYTYCPQCGNKYDSTSSPYALKCSQCGSITYLNSKPTASTLIIEGDKILLGKRKHDPEKGKWDVIGGFLEYGEDPETGAIREAKEETNLVVQPMQMLGLFMDEYGPEKISTLNICYTAKVVSGDLQAGDDIEELRWFTKNDLPDDIAFNNGKAMLYAWLVK